MEQPVELRGDGPAGNARLTGSTAAILLVLLAVEGATLLALGRLITVHVFVGVVLVPLVLLKLASTGYRLVRYYRRDAAYVRRGPPPLLLRALAPAVAVTTVTLLASGVALAVSGPGNDTLLRVHKGSFVLWFAAMAVHVLAHVWRVPGLASADWRRSTRTPGARSRHLLLAGTLAAGALLGLAVAATTAGWH